MTVVRDWSATGCWEAAPGVHRIPLGMPNDGLRAVSVYVVETAGGLVLVDGGWHVASAVEELSRGLARIGRRLDEIAALYVTHIHRDHYTLAVELRRLTGAAVHLGRGERAGLHAVRQLDSNVPVASLRELRRAGAGALVPRIEELTSVEPFAASDWEDPDGWLDAGMLDLGQRQWEVVPTPGHTRGHVVLHDAEAGLMFTGDHVLPTITPSIGFELGAWDLPLGHYLASLRLLLARPDAVMMPAHGHPGGSVHARVRELLEHHERRLDQTLDAVRSSGRATGVDVAARLTWTRRHRALRELDAFNQMIAVCETLAHLDLLVAEGQLTSAPRDGEPSVDFAVA